MEIPHRPLGIVKELIEALGHEITYAYDDLVFIGHNDFLLRFGNENSAVDLFFNTECETAEADDIAARLLPEAGNYGLTINRKGTYTMEEAPDNNLTITFNL